MTSSVQEVIDSSEVVVISKKGPQFADAIRKLPEDRVVIDLVRLFPDLIKSQPDMKESAGKILMFVENAFPNDTRVRNECDALAEAGYAITVVALRKQGQPRSEFVNGVQVYRLPRLELFQKTPRGTRRSYSVSGSRSSRCSAM